jgi:hypothetical protein
LIIRNIELRAGVLNWHRISRQDEGSLPIGLGAIKAGHANQNTEVLLLGASPIELPLQIDKVVTCAAAIADRMGLRMAWTGSGSSVSPHESKYPPNCGDINIGTFS